MDSAQKLNDLIRDAQRIVILQADNPDADSLGSALALEHIIGDMGKEPFLYCGVDMPQYLTYLHGWDRVSRDLPTQFDLSIIVDTSADSLFEKLNASPQKTWITSKPVIVIDHHDVEPTINYATVMHNVHAVATGEAIYELAQQFQWPLNLQAKEMLATSILADSLGLASEGTSARSIHIIGELVEGGVKIAELEARRREMMRKSTEILAYKGQLLQRIEYFADQRIATVTIPWEEIEQYSNQYNPSVLVLDEMRLVDKVDLAIAFKLYKDGHMTAKIRCNFGVGIAGKLAEHFGGGGHPYASGFKITDGRPFDQIKSECIQVATELLDKLES